MTVDGKNDVAFLQQLPARTGLDHGADEDAAVVIIQAKKMTLGGILQLRVGDAEINVAIVMAVLDVLQKTANYRGGNHVSDALRDVTGVALKCDADDFAVLQNRASTVPRIDLRADLDREVRIDCRMRVEIEVDARYDAGRDRHAFAADRVTISRDGRFERGDAAKAERLHALPKIRRRHLEEREIAVVRDKQHRRRIFIRIALALDREVAAVTHDVGVGQDALAIDHKPGTDAAPDRARVPGGAIIGLHLGRGDADEAALDLAVGLRLRVGHDEERERADKNSMHQEKSGKIKQNCGAVKRQSKR